MLNLEEEMECSDENYDKNLPCYCGKVFVNCCRTKSHCSDWILIESCDSELGDKKCSDIKETLTNLVKPKYYSEYKLFSSFSDKIYVLSVVILIISFIILWLKLLWKKIYKNFNFFSKNLFSW